jgi:hypothetical protein
VRFCWEKKVFSENFQKLRGLKPPQTPASAAYDCADPSPKFKMLSPVTSFDNILDNRDFETFSFVVITAQEIVCLQLFRDGQRGTPVVICLDGA